jgi:hypothetical protein
MLLAAYANLYRVFTWEQFVFKKTVDPEIVLKPTAIKSGELPAELGAEVAAVASSSAVDAVSLASLTEAASPYKRPDPKDKRVRNAKMITYLLNEVPTQITATIHGKTEVILIAF